MQAQVKLTFELSGAVRCPVEPACWRNGLERFVIVHYFWLVPCSDTGVFVPIIGVGYILMGVMRTNRHDKNGGQK